MTLSLNVTNSQGSPGKDPRNRNASPYLEGGGDVQSTEANRRRGHCRGCAQDHTLGSESFPPEENLTCPVCTIYTKSIPL